MDARIKLSARFVFAEKACGEFQRIIGSEAAEPPAVSPPDDPTDSSG